MALRETTFSCSPKLQVHNNSLSLCHTTFIIFANNKVKDYGSPEETVQRCMIYRLHFFGKKVLIKKELVEGRLPTPRRNYMIPLFRNFYLS